MELAQWAQVQGPVAVEDSGSGIKKRMKRGPTPTVERGAALDAAAEVKGEGKDKVVD